MSSTSFLNVESISFAEYHAKHLCSFTDPVLGETSKPMELIAAEKLYQFVYNETMRALVCFKCPVPSIVSATNAYRHLVETDGHLGGGHKKVFDAALKHCTLDATKYLTDSKEIKEPLDYQTPQDGFRCIDCGHVTFQKRFMGAHFKESLECKYGEGCLVQFVLKKNTPFYFAVRDQSKLVLAMRPLEQEDEDEILRAIDVLKQPIPVSSETARIKTPLY